jgi:EAL domain-containing protein (putative c-di-GMP-specific phosphodiesterase class I)
MTTTSTGGARSAERPSAGSGFAEAADQAVNLRALAVVLLAGAATVFLGQRWWDPTADARVTVPVFYALAVVGAGLCAFLLHVRSRLVDDVRSRWVAAGFLVAAAVGAIQGVAVIELNRAPFGVSADGVAVLFLLWHAALPTFVLAGGFLGERARVRHLLVAGWGVAMLVAIGLRPDPTGGWLVDATGAFSAAYGLALLALGGVTLGALVHWSLAAGRRATRPQVWVAVCLALALLDLLLSYRAERLFEAIWWSSAALRSLQFAVPAVGLLADSARLSSLLHRHERGLAAKLEAELALAAEQVPGSGAAGLPTVAAPGRGETGTPARDVPAASERVRAVIDAGAFHTVYQPVYSLVDGRLVAVEALTRFTQGPDRPPDVWFAEAHTVGLGVELELVTLQRALRTAIAVPHGIAVSVNLSPSAVVDGRIRDELERWTRHPLVVEITEHAAVDDYHHLAGVLAELRVAGVRVAVDDAGAGFASLRHVVRLAPDIIKLDRTLTRDVHVDPVQRSLATCLASFAQQNDTMLVAEGIEHPDELATWQELGADAAQGYLLGRPGPLPTEPVAPVQVLPRPRRHRSRRENVHATAEGERE